MATSGAVITLALMLASVVALPTPQSPIEYRNISLDGRNVTLSTALASNSDTPSSVVLLLHGWPEASWMWRGLVDPLLAADKARLLIMPDQRGFNTSSRPREIQSYDASQIVADAVQLVKQVAPGQKVHVIGHDWGCAPMLCCSTLYCYCTVLYCTLYTVLLLYTVLYCTVHCTVLQ